MRITPTPRRIMELAQQIGRQEAMLFDLDGTLFVKQLLIELMLAIGRKFPSRRKLVEPLRIALRRYRSERTYDFEPVVKAAVEVVSALFVGLPQRSVRKIAGQVVAKLGGETYLFPRTVLECYSRIPLEERGPIIAITGAPQEIAEIFCQRFGFDLVYGVKYQVVNGRYTGVRDSRAVDDKGGIVDELAKDLNLDLRQCCAFGDTMSDLPMFERVGWRFAVNPHLKLLEVISNSGFPRIIWVNDRQKNGVTFLEWKMAWYMQRHQGNVLPDFLDTCMPELPGPPCSMVL